MEPTNSLKNILFSRGHATLHLAVSVSRSVHRSHFWIPSSFCITTPAQPSATGLPCIRPCYHWFFYVMRRLKEQFFFVWFDCYDNIRNCFVNFILRQNTFFDHPLLCNYNHRSVFPNVPYAYMLNFILNLNMAHLITTKLKPHVLKKLPSSLVSLAYRHSVLSKIGTFPIIQWLRYNHVFITFLRKNKITEVLWVPSSLLIKKN